MLRKSSNSVSTPPSVSMLQWGRSIDAAEIASRYSILFSKSWTSDCERTPGASGQGGRELQADAVKCLSVIRFHSFERRQGSD